MTAFWEGMLAGYGIAIPVGAIAILIVETSLRRGFSFGFMAGAGAATGDFLYASLAATAGQALASTLAPAASLIQVLSALVLLILGGNGLRQVRARRNGAVASSVNGEGGNHLRTYFKYLGLTMLNPLTVAYFGALILGGGSKSVVGTLGRVAFIAGAALASLSWQTLLAGIGAMARTRLSSQFQQYASVLGYLIIVGFGLRIVMQLLA